MRNVAKRYRAAAAKREKQLPRIKEVQKRMRTLRYLLDYYIYTQPDKAKGHLAELFQLAQAQKDNETLSRCHIHQAFLDKLYYQHESAIAHLQEAKRLLEYESLSKRLPEVYVELSGIHFNMKEREKSLARLNEAERILAAHPDPVMQASILNRKAAHYNRDVTSETAIEMLLDARNLLESGKLSKGIGDYRLLSLIYSGLGYSYAILEDRQSSIEAYLKAIQISEEFGFGIRLAWYYLLLGNAYSSIQKFGQARQCFEKALSDTPKDLSPHARAGASANLGQLYFMDGDFEAALAHYDEAEQLYQQHQGLDDEFNFSVLLRYRAQLHAEQGREEKAMEYYEGALNYAKNQNDYRQMSALYRDLAVHFEEKGDYRRAYEFQIRYSESREKLINEEKVRSFAEMEVKHEMEKREQEAEFLRLQTTELQLKALRAQMNPHFIFNSLNSIQGYIMRNEVDQAAKFFSRFSRLIRSSLEYSDFNVIPLESEIQFLNDYLQLEKERFKGDFDYEIIIDEEVEEDIMGVPPMIVQPYVENAVKHGVRDVCEGFVSISFSIDDDEHLLCIIEDNGVGRELAAKRQEELHASKHRSMGTDITQQRLELFNQTASAELSTQTIDLRNEDGQPAGTRVELRIPSMDIDPKFFDYRVW